jgi:hypothetical protein
MTIKKYLEKDLKEFMPNSHLWLPLGREAGGSKGT